MFSLYSNGLPETGNGLRKLLKKCELVTALAKLNKAFLYHKIQEGSFCELPVNAVSMSAGAKI